MKADLEFLGRSNVAFIKNRDPILKVLQSVSPSSGKILEIGSGIGNHAHYFTPHFPGITWQTSEADRDNITHMEKRMEEAPANLLPPIHLDVRTFPWPVTNAQVIIAINVLHIMPWEGAEGLIKGASDALEPGGAVYLYGAYKQGGRHTTKSNEAFDKSLRDRNPAWGVRDLDRVTALAQKNGLERIKTLNMPNNNLFIVLAKTG